MIDQETGDQASAKASVLILLKFVNRMVSALSLPSDNLLLDHKLEGLIPFINHSKEIIFAPHDL